MKSNKVLHLGRASPDQPATVSADPNDVTADIDRLETEAQTHSPPPPNDDDDEPGKRFSNPVLFPAFETKGLKSLAPELVSVGPFRH